MDHARSGWEFVITASVQDIAAHGVTYSLHKISFLLSTDKFILRGEETEAVLRRLVSHGKKLFLITNSPFSFV